MIKFVSWIPYIFILSFGMCYTFDFNTGLGLSIAIGSLIGMIVDYDKKRKKQKQKVFNNN